MFAHLLAIGPVQSRPQPWADQSDPDGSATPRRFL